MLRTGILVAVLTMAAAVAPGRADLVDPADVDLDSLRELARRDPFVVLVEAPKARTVQKPPETVLVPPPPPPAPPPLVVEVAAVARAPERQVALIRYRGEEYLVHPGWTGEGIDGFDGRFRVKAFETGMLVVEDRLLGTEAGFPF